MLIAFFVGKGMFLNGSLGQQYIGRCFLPSGGSLLSVLDRNRKRKSERVLGHWTSS